MLDRLLADFTVETVLRDVVLPYLHAVGERWERGEAIVAQEHFASNLLRGRLANLAGDGETAMGRQRCSPALPAKNMTSRSWHSGSCCTAMGGASPTRREHPTRDVTRTAELQPDLIVLAAVSPSGSTVQTATSPGWRASPRSHSPAPARRARAQAVGAHLLDEDPVTAAEQMRPRVSESGGAPAAAAGESSFG